MAAQQVYDRTKTLASLQCRDGARRVSTDRVDIERGGGGLIIMHGLSVMYGRRDHLASVRWRSGARQAVTEQADIACSQQSRSAVGFLGESHENCELHPPPRTACEADFDTVYLAKG